MTPRVARLLHGSTALVGGTGIVYAWMRWVAEPQDEFSILGHPWQPHFQHSHIVLAPILLFACGLIWRNHVWARIQSGFRDRRPTGIALAALLFPMTFTGYFLQVTVDEGWRQAWSLAHLVTSTLWLVAYGLHPFVRARSGRAATQAATGTSTPPAPLG